MSPSTGADDSSTFSNIDVIQQAMKALSQTVRAHVDRESRLERFCQGWQQNWLAQCDQLRMRIDLLESQLAPWITTQSDGPRLSIVSSHDDAV